uniref:Uncharacterized protein At2g23370 n=1 Tax=Arabidopsis thaliana TaxID=3702 RepID=O80454_ARATH|nr:hypothetical protein [Arabidopsis thaliana]
MIISFVIQVGLFPDSLERKVIRHIENGDHLTCFLFLNYLHVLIQGFSFGGYRVLYKERELSRICPAIRFQRKSFTEVRMILSHHPSFSLVNDPQEIAQIAEWGEEQIAQYKERVTGEGKQRDIDRGKPMAQASLDEAAFLLNLASLEGTWDESLERVAQCYKEAGLNDIAKFVLYRD